jgi:hypothetical protein
MLAAALLPGCGTESVSDQDLYEGESLASAGAAAPGSSSTSPDQGGGALDARQGESCLDGRPCDPGLVCMSYRGFGGNPLATCEVPCEDDSACPAGQACVYVYDGPGRVCHERREDQVAPAGPGQGEPCPDHRCAEGLQCLEYYGFAGPRGGLLTSCEIPCGEGAACPADQHCVNVADGPGQVCRR